MADIALVDGVACARGLTANSAGPDGSAAVLLRAVYEMLGNPVVREDRSCKWHCVDSCSPAKAQPEDRLMDPVICCEALFLMRHGTEGR
jgi:hypothetical protein